MLTPNIAVILRFRSVVSRGFRVVVALHDGFHPYMTELSSTLSQCAVRSLRLVSGEQATRCGEIRICFKVLETATHAYLSSGMFMSGSDDLKAPNVSYVIHQPRHALRHQPTAPKMSPVTPEHRGALGSNLCFARISMLLTAQSTHGFPLRVPGPGEARQGFLQDKNRTRRIST